MDLDEYVHDRWDFEEASKRSRLGFLGFVFQSALLVAISVAAMIRADGDLLRAYRLMVPIAAITVLGGAVAFWLLWYWEARKLRWLVTRLLNRYGNVEAFEIPKVSALNSRYVPEAALVLVMQAYFLLVVFLLWSQPIAMLRPSAN